MRTDVRVAQELEKDDPSQRGAERQLEVACLVAREVVVDYLRLGLRVPVCGGRILAVGGEVGNEKTNVALDTVGNEVLHTVGPIDCGAVELR